MRVKELADLTGTTVRTIRHYHHVGLLPVPAVRYSHRDYDLAHVARLTRIRWLTRAGVPLATINDILGAAPDDEDQAEQGRDEARRDSVLADLRATLTALDEQIEVLTGQRARVGSLIEAVGAGAPLSPLPTAVVRFFDDLERRSQDVATRRLIRRERDFTEVAYFRGEMPPEAQILYEGLDEVALDESLASYGALAEQAGSRAHLTDAEIEDYADAVVDRLERRLGDARIRLARTIDVANARRAADLYVLTARPEHRRLERSVADAVIAAIVRWGSS